MRKFIVNVVFVALLIFLSQLQTEVNHTDVFWWLLAANILGLIEGLVYRRVQELDELDG